MQNYSALAIKPKVGDAKRVAGHLLAQWGEARLHGPDKVDITVTLEGLMNLNVDSRTGFAQSGEVIDDGLFVARNH